MSENWITIIPADPHARPAPTAIDAALALFKELAPNAAQITTEGDGDQIQFFDCGGNFEEVRCPACKTRVEIRDWQRWMNADYGPPGFALNPFKMPCCGTQTTVNDLTYIWPQGFARIGVSARDPDLGRLSDDQLKAFEQAMGCPVRAFYVHI